MRTILLIAAGVAALSGVAMAQEGGPPHGPPRMFERADANNDGVVTRQEFDAARDGHFAEMDANRDGQLAREEMHARHEGRRGGHHERRGHGGHEGHFGRADANNDGNITREEFLAQPSQMFARLDANNDGVISQAERPQRGEEREGHRHGPREDADGDRQISRDEFRTMGAAMFDRLDANDDGRVTREEAEAMHRGGSHH